MGGAAGPAGLGLLLRGRRQAAGLTQEELAQQAGLSVRTIRDLELGTRRPHPRTVAALAAALGLDPADGAAPALPAPADQARPAGAVVPRLLPPAVPGFVGREQELATLNDLLGAPPGAARAMLISAIAGTAGVGKTALAVRWAHQAAGEFPDGQLYVNLRGYDSDQPMPATDALAGFLRALGVPGQQIPPDEADRTASYRSLLARRRVLVLLDNAREVAQVRPLLPGHPGCTVVVTSRDALPELVTGDGARRLELDLLPPAEAAALLHGLIGGRAAADPGATAELARLCARLPLALRVAAEHAAAFPAVSLAALAAELGDQQRRLDLLDVGGDPLTAVRAVFSWSVRHLEPAAARAFRLLGLHPGPDLDRYAAAALTGTALAEAGRLLDRLVRGYLVQPSGPGRYAMHDLLRAYAVELARDLDGPDQERAALTRLFDHYLGTAAAAMDVLYPAEHDVRPRVPPPATPGPRLRTGTAARAWLDAERACLVVATAHTAEHGWPGHATRLPAVVFRYLDSGGHAPEAMTAFGHAARAARQAGDRPAEALAVTSLGLVSWNLSRYAEATGHLRQAIALYREAGDEAGAARALGNLGQTESYLCHYPQAAAHLTEALAHYRASGRRLLETKALMSLGIIEIRRGQHEAGLAYLRQVRDLCRDLGDRIGQAFVLCNVGNIDMRQGRYRQAAEQTTAGLALFREVGHRVGETFAMQIFGGIDLYTGRHQRAATWFERAAALAQETGNRNNEGEALTYLGAAEARLGRHQQAVAHHEQALVLFREIGELPGQATALNGLGEAALAAGRPGTARREHTAALGLATRIGHLDEQARAHDGLGHAWQALGDPDQARRHWQQALARYTELGDPAAGRVAARLTGPAALAGES